MPSDREAAIAAAVAVFQKDVGEWDAVLEVRPQPGAPPLVQKGVYRNRMVGGRWLIVDYSSDSGFEGHGVYGWDPDLGAYVGTWDPDARTMTFVTEATHGGRPVRYREITQAMPDGTQVYRNLVP
ncbi:MAG TPA: DUF1579 family protein, partial [Acidobacteriota bacterium]|nr:DUF1579 family protein [Acidobacteriota bacterium]